MIRDLTPGSGLWLLLSLLLLFAGGCTGISPPVVELAPGTAAPPESPAPAVVEPAWRMDEDTPRHQRVRALLTKEPVYYLSESTSRSAFNEARPGFCEQFLVDWRMQRGISYLNPVVQTDDYHAPELLAYSRRYAGVLRQSTIQFLGSQAGQRKIITAQSGYRIYEVDIDNLPDNGAEIVFSGDDWGGGYATYRMLREAADGSLEQVYGLKTHPTVRDGIPQPSNLSEIIRYRGFNFIVSMGSLSKGSTEVTTIQLRMPGPMLEKRGAMVCNFGKYKIRELGETS